MKAIELFEKYPEAAEVAIQYYADEFLRAVENTDVPDEFREFAKQQRIDDQYVADFIDNNPRGTFDMFDNNDVYIQIGVYPDRTFNCTINELGTTSFFATRKEAETCAVEAAFEILNNKLCQTK
jgi:hypothetical protein